MSHASLRLYKPVGVVQISSIFENRASIKRILHWNRKEGYFGFFWYWPGAGKGKRSPIWAYFTSESDPSISGPPSREKWEIIFPSP
jgi:hypothetical protein